MTVKKGKYSKLPKAVEEAMKKIIEAIESHYTIIPEIEIDPHKINVVPRAEGGYWLVEEEDMILFEDEGEQDD